MVFLISGVSLLSAFAYFCFGRKLFAIFQQCGYSPRTFFKSLGNECKPEIERLSTYSLTFFIYSLVFSPLFAYFSALYVVVLFLGALAFFFVVFIKNKPIKEVRLTARFVRMTVVSVLIFVGTIAAVTFSWGEFVGFDLRICLVVSAIISAACLMLPAYIGIGSLILLPYDRFLYGKSIKACKKRLAEFPSLIKIGITGSYGKTSVKNILEKMLSTKYKVVATPLSYNTPLGICKAAKDVDKTTEIFIAEVGARNIGDIKELCEIVKPDVGIITGICGQHLETFLSVENVKRAKNELIEALPIDGYAFFSSDSKGSEELFEKCSVTKFLAGASGGEVSLKSFREEESGAFLEIQTGGKTYSFRTELRGRANASNICLAAAVALKMGITPERIVVAAERLKPSPHRLEVLRANGIIVIDDSYNANIESVKAAAEVLKCFGGRKFTVTPGIVEAGESSQKTNVEAGKILSFAADEIVAVGANYEAIVSGAERRCCVTEVKNLEEAKEILAKKVKAGDVVLFLNDIPDRYGS